MKTFSIFTAVYYLFLTVTYAESSDQNFLSQAEIIAGSTFIVSRNQDSSGSRLSAARVFVVSEGCTKKESFKIRVDSVQFVKGMETNGIVYTEEMPIIHLTLLRIKGDGCRAQSRVKAIDFSPAEILTSIDQYLQNKRTIYPSEIIFIKWNNLMQPIFESEFIISSKSAISP